MTILAKANIGPGDVVLLLMLAAFKLDDHLLCILQLIYIILALSFISIFNLLEDFLRGICQFGWAVQHDYHLFRNRFVNLYLPTRLSAFKCAFWRFGSWLDHKTTMAAAAVEAVGAFAFTAANNTARFVHFAAMATTWGAYHTVCFVRDTYKEIAASAFFQSPGSSYTCYLDLDTIDSPSYQLACLLGIYTPIGTDGEHLRHEICLAWLMQLGMASLVAVYNVTLKPVVGWYLAFLALGMPEEKPFDEFDEIAELANKLASAHIQ